MLLGLERMHTFHMAHGAVQPHHILIRFEWDSVVATALCDFGHCRVCLEDFHDSSPLLGPVNYQAPEVLLGSLNWDVRMDLWSVGLIAAELGLGRPLWAETNSALVLRRIFNHLPTRPEDVPQLQTYPGWLPDLLASEPNGSWHGRVQKGLSIGGVGFVCALLALVPSNRLSATSALEHSYFSDEEARAAAVEADDATTICYKSVEDCAAAAVKHGFAVLQQVVPERSCRKLVEATIERVNTCLAGYGVAASIDCGIREFNVRLIRMLRKPDVGVVLIFYPWCSVALWRGRSIFSDHNY